MEKVILSWSGGKDSALALHEILKSKKLEIITLLTTITEDYKRTSMHGVREALLEDQVSALGLPLEKVYISKKDSFEEYGLKMQSVLKKYKDLGVTSVVFGDIFLEDVRKYREDNLAKLGMKGIFPLWKRETHDLARAFIDLGFGAIVTCVDTKVLDRKFVGRDFDAKFLSEIESLVDPCAENGEFHSFAYAGPIFQNKVSFKKGDTVLRDNRFYYIDLDRLI